MNDRNQPKPPELFNRDRSEARLHMVAFVGVFAIALTIVAAGIIAIVYGSVSASEVELLGQKLRTWHVGVAMVFIGAVCAYFSIKAVLNSMHKLKQLTKS